METVYRMNQRLYDTIRYEQTVDSRGRVSAGISPGHSHAEVIAIVNGEYVDKHTHHSATGFGLCRRINDVKILNSCCANSLEA